MQQPTNSVFSPFILKREKRARFGTICMRPGRPSSHSPGRVTRYLPGLRETARAKGIPVGPLRHWAEKYPDVGASLYLSGAEARLAAIQAKKGDEPLSLPRTGLRCGEVREADRKYILSLR